MTVRRRTVVWSSVAGAALVGTVVTAALTGSLPGAADAAGADESPGRPPTTASVEQGTLTGTTTATGKLSRLEGPDVSGSLQGTLTSLPDVDTSLASRSELFRVDDVPVTAFEGTLPQWRSFEQGMQEGPDVKQVEEALAAWGHFTGTPDDVFSWRTSSAIDAWQKATGQERTGSIALGAVQFVTGEFTVSNVTAAVGDASSGGPLYETKRDDKVVSVDLPAGSPLAALGGVASLVLPGTSAAPGQVTGVEPAVVDDASGKSTIPATVSFDDPTAAGDLTEASVQVDFVSDVREDVLHVPVLALGAATQGGFVLDVVRPDGSVEVVAVQTGLFAGDRVEVTGDVAEGDRVVVPA